MTDQVRGRLKKMAEAEGLTPSQLAEVAIERLVEYDYLRNRFAMMNFPSIIGQRMLKSRQDEDIRELADWASDSIVKPFMMFWFGKEDIESAVSSLCVLRACAKSFEVEHNRSYSTWLIVIKHEQGRAWSTFYEELLERLFTHIPSVERVTSEMTDQQASVEVLVKPAAVKPKVGPTQRAQLEPMEEEADESTAKRVVSEG